MAKFRSWNEEIKKFNYFEDGEYYYFTTNLRGNKKIKIDCETRIEDSNFNWQNAQRFLFSNKFSQEIYVGSTLEGVILGSKVIVVVEEDNFGVVHARCIECKSTENSESFNLNDIDILWCYNLKVIEDKLMENE